MIRAGMLQAGCGMLGRLLAADPGYRGPRVACGQGHEAEFVSYRGKVIDTVLGPVTLTRAWYHCTACGHGLAPPADLERTAAPPPVPDRIHAHIKPVHLYPPIAAATWIAARSVIAAAGCADGAARPYGQLSVGRAPAEQGAMAMARVADEAVLCSAAMRALDWRYDRGHAPG